MVMSERNGFNHRSLSLGSSFAASYSLRNIADQETDTDAMFFFACFDRVSKSIEN